ncbi:MAG: hypothetical protein JWQ69_4921 [Pseudomonas sp.]|nr:hypothetical protein [Pseudomonas sp.]
MWLAQLFHRAKLSPAKAGLGYSGEVLANAVCVVVSITCNTVCPNVISTISGYAVCTDVVSAVSSDTACANMICTVSSDVGSVDMSRTVFCESRDGESCASQYRESQTEDQFRSFHESRSAVVWKL